MPHVASHVATSPRPRLAITTTLLQTGADVHTCAPGRHRFRRIPMCTCCGLVGLPDGGRLMGPSGNRAKTDARMAEIRRRTAAGENARSIADDLGMSRSGVYRVIKAAREAGILAAEVRS